MACRNLLPTCYHHLMMDEDSLIKKYYPEDFQTDLNGKKQEWEAVVLVPFIDEVRNAAYWKTSFHKTSFDSLRTIYLLVMPNITVKISSEHWRDLKICLLYAHPCFKCYQLINNILKSDCLTSGYNWVPWNAGPKWALVIGKFKMHVINREFIRAYIWVFVI